MPAERVAYVLVSHRTPRLAEAARTSILSYRPDAHVLVVEAFRRDGPDLGYSEALNRGVRELPSRVEYVACLNADVKMTEPDEPILDLFDADPEVAVIGPRQVNGDERVAHGGIVPYEDGTEWDLDLHHRCWLWDRAEAEELTDWTVEVPMVPGSVLYARRSALGELGGWPEWTSFYYEDAYLCYLARHRGHRVLYTGRVTWLHYGEQGSPIGERSRRDRMEVARRRFVEECRSAGIPLRGVGV